MVVDKFGRNYDCEIVFGNGDTLIVQLPFTIEFDITRNTLTSANVCQIRLYNLSEVNRNRIRKNAGNYSNFIFVHLRAGYGENLATIFKGSISEAWSVREGVNFITQMECYDGGPAYTNGYTNRTFPARTTERDIIISLIKTLPSTELGTVGPYTNVLTRSASYDGSTTQILSELTGGGFFIDNGKANALKSGEYIANTGEITVISAESGLLGTPILENNLMRFDMLFEPSLNIGNLVLLKSSTLNNFNGQYKITAVKHRGMISASVAGTVITSGEFFAFKPLSPVM